MRDIYKWNRRGFFAKMGAAPAGPRFAKSKPERSQAETMPYFVFKITPPRILDFIETKDKYQEARALVRSLRGHQDAAADVQYRLVFAKDRPEAEKLLSTPRDERVIGED